MNRAERRALKYGSFSPNRKDYQPYVDTTAYLISQVWSCYDEDWDQLRKIHYDTLEVLWNYELH